MGHRPVCVKCKCEMKPEKNGMQVVDTLLDVRYQIAEPYQIWDADKWKCPKCGIEIMSGFGNVEWSHRGDSAFDATLRKVHDKDNYVECFYPKGN